VSIRRRWRASRRPSRRWGEGLVEASGLDAAASQALEFRTSPSGRAPDGHHSDDVVTVDSVVDVSFCLRHQVPPDLLAPDHRIALPVLGLRPNRGVRNCQLLFEELWGLVTVLPPPSSVTFHVALRTAATSSRRTVEPSGGLETLQPKSLGRLRYRLLTAQALHAVSPGLRRRDHPHRALAARPPRLRAIEPVHR
jgi:hypothetical protein